jgi:hypothetical protein
VICFIIYLTKQCFTIDSAFFWLRRCRHIFQTLSRHFIKSSCTLNIFVICLCTYCEFTVHSTKPGYDVAHQECAPHSLVNDIYIIKCIVTFDSASEQEQTLKFYTSDVRFPSTKTLKYSFLSSSGNRRVRVGPCLQFISHSWAESGILQTGDSECETGAIVLAHSRSHSTKIYSI